MSVTDLVLLVVRMVESQQDIGDSSAGTIRFDRPLDQADVARMLGIGLSLLSMQGDVLDSMLRSAAEQPGGGRATAADLQNQKNVLKALLVSLWAAAIKVQTNAWLGLCLVPDLSFQEEDLIRSQTVFYQALLAALSEVVGGTLRGDLLPGERSPDLLDAAIEASGVARLGIDQEGATRSLAEGSRNARAVFILKVAVDMAVAAVNEVVQEMM